MKFVIAVIFVLAFVMITIPATVTYGQQRGEEIIVKKSDLPADLLKQIESKRQVEKVGSWIGLGKEVGTAVNEGLSALTKNADEFAKTGVGKFTLLMIAWKVMGWQLVHIMGGIVFFTVGMLVFSVSFWLNCRTRRMKVLLPKDGDPKYEVVQPTEDAMIFHGIFFIAVTVATLFIIFSG